MLLLLRLSDRQQSAIIRCFRTVSHILQSGVVDTSKSLFGSLCFPLEFYVICHRSRKLFYIILFYMIKELRFLILIRFDLSFLFSFWYHRSRSQSKFDWNFCESLCGRFESLLRVSLIKAVLSPSNVFVRMWIFIIFYRFTLPLSLFLSPCRFQAFSLNVIKQKNY